MALITLPSQSRKRRFRCARDQGYAYEMRDVPHLLSHLCRVLSGPDWYGSGPVPLPYGDRVYCVVLTEFFTHSVRRSEPHYEDAESRKHISRAPFASSVYDYYDDPLTTEQLYKLLRITAKILTPYESAVLLDGTHFVMGKKLKYSEDEKYADAYSVKKAGGHRYLMVHLAGGPNTRGVFAAFVDICLEEWFSLSHDYMFTERLTQEVRSLGFDFGGKEVWADKGYASGKNRAYIENSLGAKYMFTEMSGKKFSPPGDVDDLWDSPGGYKRNAIETIHSMIKQVMGEKVLCKKKVSLENEVLARVVAHNLRVIQQVVIAKNIPVDFEAVAKEVHLEAAMKSMERLGHIKERPENARGEEGRGRGAHHRGRSMTVQGVRQDFSVPPWPRGGKAAAETRRTDGADRTALAGEN